MSLLVSGMSQLRESSTCAISFFKEHLQRIRGFLVVQLLLVAPLLLVLLLLLSGAALANTPETTTNNPSALAQQHLDTFNQALSNDLAGNPALARPGYDALQITELAHYIAIPSAINMVALQRFASARVAFAELAASPDPREASYAQLWQLWLTARMEIGGPAVMQQQLRQAAANIRLATPYQQAIVDLYGGTGSTQAVFNAINAMRFNSPLDRQNVVTEATFFTLGWLLHVQHDRPAAQKLYHQQENQLCSVSLEKPLITREMAAL
ncbi:hypothetical protein EDF88_3082 [Buttiauxella sp. BIGb0552]|nr:hypothetical protein EDF88_3082 [Buttiauxella sp. BIGb0552]